MYATIRLSLVKLHSPEIRRIQQATKLALGVNYVENLQRVLTGFNSRSLAESHMDYMLI